jgi:hypothetical protein
MQWRPLIAKLSFSFVAVGGVLAWRGYRLSQEQGDPSRVYTFYVVAIVLFSVGFSGLRERHRP